MNTLVRHDPTETDTTPPADSTDPAHRIDLDWQHGLGDGDIPDAVDVLISGGGPVASALAVELGTRGIRAVAFDSQPRLLARDVRARSLSLRTMEHVRRWGLDATLRANATVPAAWRQRGFTYVTSLAGHVLLQTDPPSPTQWRALAANANFGIPQYYFTAILRRRAFELGNPVFPGWTVTAFENAADGVHAHLQKTDGGARRTIFARYVVGADGGHSVVRESQGITRTETPVRNIRFNVAIRIPGIFEQLGLPPHGLFSLFNPQAQSVFCPFDPERWGFNAGPFPAGTRAEEVDFVQEAHNRIGKAVPVEIDSVSSYTVQKRIADRFRQGRFFLAGDAAHLTPPFIGNNLNTGIEDIANLGWKLAAVLQGWGGDALLESYHQERHFIAHRVADETLKRADEEDHDREFVRRHAVRDDDTSAQAADTRARLAQHLSSTLPRRSINGVVLDQRYDHSAITVGDGAPPSPWQAGAYTPLARPGHRAPHLFITAGQALYDLFGPGFALLVRDQHTDDPQTGALLAAAARAALPVTAVAGAHPDLAPLYPHRYTLVRPDQYVAWSGDHIPADIDRILDTVRGATPRAA